MIILIEIIFNIEEIKINNKIINYKNLFEKKRKLLENLINESFPTTIDKNTIFDIRNEFIKKLYFLRDIRNSICHSETLQIFWIKKRILIIRDYINKKTEEKFKKIKAIQIRKRKLKFINDFPFVYTISTKLISDKRYILDVEEEIKNMFIKSIKLIEK